MGTEKPLLTTHSFPSFVQILSIVPSEMFRWVLVVIGFGISGAFMFRSMRGITGRSEDKRASSFVLPLMIFAQFCLAVVFKMVFFKFVVLRSPGTGGGGGGDDDGALPGPNPLPTEPSRDDGNDTTNETFQALF